jgi:hypothetical protein
MQVLMIASKQSQDGTASKQFAQELSTRPQYFPYPVSDSDLILSKHCANGNSVTGKRFKFLHGEETEQYVQDDPFQIATSSRRKRSPDFFDNLRQKVKDLWERTKKFFGIGQQTDGNGQEGREGKGS